tara:strand:+ start:265 stop:492 length:228 start_codon:yes stop_codon:yes gene_type:complete
MHYYKYAGAGAGVLFAGTVINPNFLRRRSWYGKKMMIGWCGVVGYAFAHRYFEDQILFTMLKMNDYMPMEIKRAL